MFAAYYFGQPYFGQGFADQPPIVSPDAIAYLTVRVRGRVETVQVRPSVQTVRVRASAQEVTP